MPRCWWLAWLLVQIGGTGACASAPPPEAAPAPAPAPASTSTSSTSTSVPASASASAAASARAPLGGVVLIGKVVSPPSFDPNAALVDAKPRLRDCYNQARQATPSLRGKLTLRINVNEAGRVLLVDAAPGGSAADPSLVACLSAALGSLKFPKPGGLATIVVPLVFRP